MVGHRGHLGFPLGEERSAAPAGTFVFVPRTVPHAFQNVGATPARILVLDVVGPPLAVSDPRL